MTGPDLLLAAALGTPALGLLACLWRPARDRMLGLLVLMPLPALGAAVWCLLPIGIGSGLATGIETGLGSGPWPGPGSAGAVFGSLSLDPQRLRIGLALDLPGAVLLGVAALLWSAAGAYARAYLRGRPNGGRFAVYWLLTLIGSLGVFVAGDLASFYLLFSLVSLAAYGLVVHDGTPRARRAGLVYLTLALLGEVFLLMAFVLLAAAIPDDSLAIGDAVAALPGSPWRGLTLALLIAGFGLKAGLAPLHVWLPIAHPAAPMPASAVLSGAIVKAGIVGLIRFLPWDGGLDPWGGALAAVGLVTAFYGVAIGIVQDNPKTVLAYSTASQMGVVCAVLGLGLAAADPGAIAAGTFYAAHHLLAKGALFLAVGTIAATGPRRLRLALIPVGILALGLAGLPLTGGALAKLAAKPVLGTGAIGWLGALSAAGTALLMIHFLRRVAAGAAAEPWESAPPGLIWPWRTLFLAALVLPWVLAPAVGLGTWSAVLDEATGWGALWGGLWPILAGALLALALVRWGGRLPRVPEGDLIAGAQGSVRLAMALGDQAERADRWLRQWPVAGVLMLALLLALWGVLVVGVRSGQAGTGSGPGGARAAAGAPPLPWPPSRCGPAGIVHPRRAGCEGVGPGIASPAIAGTATKRPGAAATCAPCCANSRPWPPPPRGSGCA